MEDKYENLEEIPEGKESLYTKTDDGYVLLPEISKIKTENSRLTQKVSSLAAKTSTEQEAVVKGLQAKVNALTDEKSVLENSIKLQKGGKDDSKPTKGTEAADALVAKYEEKINGLMSGFENKIKEMQKNVENERSKAVEMEIKSSLDKAIADSKANPLLSEIVAKNISNVDGEIVVNEGGSVKFNNDGTKMGINDYVLSLKTDDKYKSLFHTENPSGVETSSKTSLTPTKPVDQWSHEYKLKYISENGQEKFNSLLATQLPTFQAS